MIDLVSKEDVIDAIYKISMGEKSAATVAFRLRDYIEKMPAVKNRERTEWTLCSESTPEEGEIVLCSIPADREYCARIAFGYYMFGQWKKTDWLGSIGEYGPMEPEPDAWMPMPKPHQTDMVPFFIDGRVVGYCEPEYMRIIEEAHKN